MRFDASAVRIPEKTSLGFILARVITSRPPSGIVSIHDLSYLMIEHYSSLLNEPNHDGAVVTYAIRDNQWISRRR